EIRRWQLTRVADRYGDVMRQLEIDILSLLRDPRVPVPAGVIRTRDFARLLYVHGTRDIFAAGELAVLPPGHWLRSAFVAEECLVLNGARAVIRGPASVDAFGERIARGWSSLDRARRLTAEFRASQAWAPDTRAEERRRLDELEAEIGQRLGVVAP